MDLLFCIFIVYLRIHALLVSYHLNWLMCHYFLCGWLIVLWQFQTSLLEEKKVSGRGFHLKG